MGYISVFTCVSLTIERWIAVVKPNMYRSLKRKHAVLTIILVWFLGVAANSTTLFLIHYVPDKHLCKWTTHPFAAKAFPWIDLNVQAIIPYTTMVLLYAHIYFRMKNLSQMASSCDFQLKKVTIVAMLTCSALIISWLPGRITFTLSKFGYLHASGIIHTSFQLITFCNSCVNPWLYGMYSRKFRKEYKIVFNKVLKLCGTTARITSSVSPFQSAENARDPAGRPTTLVTSLPATGSEL